MGVYKKCKCKDKIRCKDPWWLAKFKGRPYRMPLNNFALAHGSDHFVTSKQEAENVWYPMFLREIAEGKDPTKPAPRAEGITVAEFLKDYVKRHCEAENLHMDSLEQRLGKIDERFGKLLLKELENPRHIEDFKADLMKKGRANATVNRYLSQLRHMINWAIGRGQMEKSPFYSKLKNPAGVKLLKGENQRKRRLGEGEEELLLDAADKLFQRNKVDHEYVARVMRARIEIALDFGLRRGEMLKIKNRDIDWHAKPDPILIIHWGNAKSRKERKIALVSPRVVKWLKGRRLVGGLDGPPYGDERGGENVDFKNAWASVLELAHITIPKKRDGDLNWHDLRHECGSRLAERGVDVRKVQELLGHASITTTQRYFNTSTHAVGQAMKKAMGW